MLDRLDSSDYSPASVLSGLHSNLVKNQAPLNLNQQPTTADQLEQQNTQHHQQVSIENPHNIVNNSSNGDTPLQQPIVNNNNNLNTIKETPLFMDQQTHQTPGIPLVNQIPTIHPQQMSVNPSSILSYNKTQAAQPNLVLSAPQSPVSSPSTPDGQKVAVQTCSHPSHMEWWGTSPELPISEFYNRSYKCKKCYIRQQTESKKLRMSNQQQQQQQQQVQQQPVPQQQHYAANGAAYPYTATTTTALSMNANLANITGNVAGNMSPKQSKKYKTGKARYEGDESSLPVHDDRSFYSYLESMGPDHQIETYHKICSHMVPVTNFQTHGFNPLSNKHHQINSHLTGPLDGIPDYNVTFRIQGIDKGRGFLIEFISPEGKSYRGMVLEDSVKTTAAATGHHQHHHHHHHHHQNNIGNGASNLQPTTTISQQLLMTMDPSLQLGNVLGSSSDQIMIHNDNNNNDGTHITGSNNINGNTVTSTDNNNIPTSATTTAASLTTSIHGGEGEVEEEMSGATKSETKKGNKKRKSIDSDSNQDSDHSDNGSSSGSSSGSTSSGDDKSTDEQDD